MPAYTMSCFKLPISLCNQLQSILTRFWWDDKPDKRKMSWVSWGKLSTPKNAGGLGFRDIENFNDSLLAKVGWRILTNPSSLLGRILLGKYCHNSSFMECKVPSNPSHGWRSILAGREILAKGIGWSIGSGENISLWHDPWLSLSTPTRPIGPPTQQTAHLMVSDIIHHDTNQWNIEAVRRLIPHHENEIKQIPLSRTKRQDSWIWLPLKRGAYSTRSGYGLLTTEAVSEASLAFNWQANIWKLRTPPKIKNFLWKASAGALPVAHQLHVRGITADPLCKRCGGCETPLHVLVECPFAQEVWTLAPLSCSLREHYGSILQFLQEGKAWRSLPPTGLHMACLYAWICWNLWTSRNALIFEDRHYSPVEIITKSLIDARLWQAAQAELPKPRQPLPSTSPTTQDLPSLRCYVNASWQQDTRECGMGWVAFNGSSQLFQATASRTHVISALAAEAWALREALLDCKARGMDTVHFLSYSLTLVKVLNSDEMHIEVQAIVADIKEICESFMTSSFSFIPRTSNSLADMLAKSAFVNSTPVVSGST